MEHFISYLQKKALDITSNDSELASYGVVATYQNQVSQVDFVWRVFSEGLIQNIMSRSSGTISLPVLDDAGEIEYLWSRYSIKEFSLEEVYGRA